MPWLRRVWEAWFGEPLRKVEAESLAYRLSDAGRQTDWKTPVVLLTAAVCLTLQQYTSHPYQVIDTVRFVASAFGSDAVHAVTATLRGWGGDQLANRVWWCTVAVITYAVLPWLVLRFAFGERLDDYGLKFRGALAAWRLYVVCVAVMVPLVWYCSTEERFQQTYPFLRVASAEEVRADLWKWELCYAAQFVGLEFFFRGFLVHGTKHRFGAGAVFVSVVPYAMIHFGKPMPEAFASIVAGVALGFISLTTRSIWLGAALHIAVAWSMDLACLARRGLL